MELLDLAKTLISFRTEAPPGNEEGCARFIHDYLEDLRLDDSEVVLDRFSPGRANLVFRLGARGKKEQSGLLLGGHTDVVPSGDQAQWSHDPFEARLDKGKLYGRGSADMKSGLAALLKAIESTRSIRSGRRKGLVFVATAGEEVGFEGLSALVARGLVRRGDALRGVLAEPTGLRPVRAHKGGATFMVTFPGRSGHASRPELGVNAVENCTRFVTGLSRWREDMGRKADPELGRTLATATVVHGGTKSNVIPGSCELTVDARWIPGHSTSYVRKGLSSIITSLRDDDPSFRARLTLLYQNYALNVPREDRIVSLAESLSGARGEVAPYGTEAALYARMGIPTIVLGPGSIDQAHIVDEYVRVKEIRRAEAIYSKMIDAMCR